MKPQENIFDFSTRNIENAIQDWKASLGEDSVLEGEKTASYNNCPSQTVRYIPAVLRPQSRDDVQTIMRVAKKWKVQVHPLSTGKNWGFGGSTPASNSTVVIDLSRMNRILDFIPDLGIVTVEPGVTQKQLADFLTEKGHPFVVSASSSSPHTSLIGNALERGHGMMPYMDRFMSLTSLKAVLADGSLFQSLLADGGGDEIDKTYKWGAGPYLDGLFSQGGFGIVTEASFILAPVCENVTMFMCSLDGISSPENSARFDALISTLRKLKHISGHMISTFEIGSRTGEKEKWSISGAIHAHHDMTALIIKMMKRDLKDFTQDLVFWDKTTIKRFEGRPSFFRKTTDSETYIRNNLGLMKEMLDFHHGTPQENALHYAYHEKPEVLNGNRTIENMESQMRKTGLLWYWPLVPARGEDIRLFTDMVIRVSKEHGFSPVWNINMETLTYVSAGVHIFYDPDQNKDKAWAYYKTLLEEGKKLGYLPHRIHPDNGDIYTDHGQSAYFPLLQKLKKGIDPDNILAMRIKIPHHLG